jgi:hypothetical protein
MSPEQRRCALEQAQVIGDTRDENRAAAAGAAFAIGAGLHRKRGDEARLPARAVTMLGRPGARSFGPTLWSTLMTTRRTADIAV